MRHGRLSLTTVGQPWLAMAGHGRPRLAIGHGWHGRQPARQATRRSKVGRPGRQVVGQADRWLLQMPPFTRSQDRILISRWQKNRGEHFLASWGIFKSIGEALGKIGAIFHGLDPGPAQGLTWASPGLDPGQPRSIFWSRFWSNRTTATTAFTAAPKVRAREARAPLYCFRPRCCFCCPV